MVTADQCAASMMVTADQCAASMMVTTDQCAASTVSIACTGLGGLTGWGVIN